METISEGAEFHLFKAFCHKAFLPQNSAILKALMFQKCLKTQNCSQMEVFGKAGLRLLSIRKRFNMCDNSSTLGSVLPKLERLFKPEV